MNRGMGFHSCIAQVYFEREHEFPLHARTFHVLSHLACIFSCQDEGSLGDQQWFLSAGHVQGVDSGRDIIYSFLHKVRVITRKDIK
ncbi:hypothetical protein MTR67_013952 [Solanum verrucosum]|uniref:Uncharacterized protein n=1 Tax=Solanum verrucosum TaxID=315347 RepID=A0AAF0QCV3_SOLVR|nr:hypothetical protein MTR67_013952 [Solanum verrucosum]